jgi:hypothetical protein
VTGAAVALAIATLTVARHDRLGGNLIPYCAACAAAGVSLGIHVRTPLLVDRKANDAMQRPVVGFS